MDKHDSPLPDALLAWAQQDAELVDEEALQMRDSLWGRIGPALDAALDASFADHAIRSTSTMTRLARTKLLGVGLAIGAVVGVAGSELRHRDSERSSPPIAATSLEPAPAIATQKPPTPVLLNPAGLEPAPTPAKSTAPVRKRSNKEDAAPADAVASQWDAERALIDAARTALLRNDLASALSLTSEHASRFPGGTFVEEREGLRTLARLRDAHDLAALEAAEAFRSRFPRSVFTRAISEAQAARESSQQNREAPQGSPTDTP